ncbi:MAG: efflux RND transporter permease subunit [Acidobacteriota bacterium]
MPVVPEGARSCPTEKGFVVYVAQDEKAVEKSWRPGSGCPTAASRSGRVFVEQRLSSAALSSCGRAVAEIAGRGRRRKAGIATPPRSRSAKPVFAWMMMAALTLFGVIAVTRTGISQLPDVDFPTITVAVTWEGASPEVMEATSSTGWRMPRASRSRALQQITSPTCQGAATITVELNLERDVDLALQDAQTKIAQAQRTLPKDIDPPIINKTNPRTSPSCGCSTRPAVEITDYARYVLKEKFQTIPGVGWSDGGSPSTSASGSTAASSIRHDPTIDEVTRALTIEHVEPRGAHRDRPARGEQKGVEGEALNVDAPSHRRWRAGGRPIHLSDVAVVEDGFEDTRRLARIFGEPAGLGSRSSVAPTPWPSRATCARSSRSSADAARGLVLATTFDSTKFIETVHEIELGLVLAVPSPPP